MSYLEASWILTKGSERIGSVWNASTAHIPVPELVQYVPCRLSSGINCSSLSRLLIHMKAPQPQTPPAPPALLYRGLIYPSVQINLLWLLAHFRCNFFQSTVVWSEVVWTNIPPPKKTFRFVKTISHWWFLEHPTMYLCTSCLHIQRPVDIVHFFTGLKSNNNVTSCIMFAWVEIDVPTVGIKANVFVHIFYPQWNSDPWRINGDEQYIYLDIYH